MELGRQSTDNFRNTGFFNNTTTSIQVPYSNPTISTPVTFPSERDRRRQSPADEGCSHLCPGPGCGFAYVELLGGVRFDYFDLRYRNNRNGDDLRRIDRLVSPRAGVVIKPVTPLSLYASYGVSYLPSSGDQFSSLTNITQQVKPESLPTTKLGRNGTFAEI
jgi:catecholate siderophore receptor